MKNIFKSKIILAIVACLLLVGVFAGVSTLAGNSTPTVKITAVNLSYDADARIAYAVNVDGISTELTPDNLTMLFWATDPGTANAAEALDTAAEYQDFETVDADSAILYSNGISPKRMTQVYWSCAVYTDETGNAYYSNIVRSSVIEYLSAMSLDGGTDAQEGLWSAMTDYIQYAQEYLNYDLSKPGDLCYISVVGGHVKGDSFSSGMYQVGTELTLVADTDESATFYKWCDENYAQLSTDSEYTFTASENAVYRAVHKADVTALAEVPAELTGDSTVKVYAHNLVIVNPASKGVDNGNASENGDFRFFRVTNSTTNHPGSAVTKATDTGRAAVQAVATALVGETPVYFSYWKNSDGVKVSDCSVYSFDTTGTDVSYTAVYTTENPLTSDSSWTSTSTSNTAKSATVDVSGVGTGNFYQDKTAEATAGHTVRVSNADAYTELNSRVTLGFDVVLQYNEGYSSSNTFQIKFSLSEDSSLNGDTNTLMFMQFIKQSDTNYYVQLSDRVGGKNYDFCNMHPALMEYGESAHIEVEFDITKQENGSYKLNMINYFVNGLYVGSTPVENCDTFVSTGDFEFYLASMAKTMAKVEISNLTASWN